SRFGRNASRSPFFPSTAGTIFTSSCSASLATSSAMTSWGFRSTTTPNFLRFTLLQGIAILLHGSTSSSVEIAPLECVDHSQLNASRDRGRPSHPIYRGPYRGWRPLCTISLGTLANPEAMPADGIPEGKDPPQRRRQGV